MEGAQKTDGNEERPDNQGGNSHLRLSYTAIFRSIVGVYLIRKPCTEDGGGDKSDAETEIGETSGTNPETIGMAEKFC